MTAETHPNPDGLVISRQVYRDITTERLRAHAKHSASGQGCEQMAWNDPMWLPVLAEEVGEVAEELAENPPPDLGWGLFLEYVVIAGESARKACDGPRVGLPKAIAPDVAKLRNELVQTAAMACAWIQAIDEGRT